MDRDAVAPADESDDGIAGHRAAALGELDQDVGFALNLDAADGSFGGPAQTRERRLWRQIGGRRRVNAVGFGRRRDRIGGLIDGQLAVADRDQKVLGRADVQARRGLLDQALAFHRRQAESCVCAARAPADRAPSAGCARAAPCE